MTGLQEERQKEKKVFLSNLIYEKENKWKERCNIKVNNYSKQLFADLFPKYTKKPNLNQNLMINLADMFSQNL